MRKAKGIGQSEGRKAHLASFKKPKSVEFVDRLPRSTAGKVLKRILKER